MARFRPVALWLLRPDAPQRDEEDAATLRGLLKRVRGRGIPLLSVVCTKPGRAEAAEVNEARQARSREVK